MLLTPHYGDTPLLAIDGAFDDQRDTVIRQRSRMADALADLTDEQWHSPSRCDEWSAQDVVSHLIGTNDFWALSINAGLAGEPTRFLAAFDPVASPPQMVAALPSMKPAETLERFVDSNETVFEAIAALDEPGWSTLAESPPGHVPIRLLAHHALWDAWVHERDVLLPLGIEPVEDADEVESSLRYAAALSPLFAVTMGHDHGGGSIVIDAVDPDAHIVIDVTDTVVVHSGPAPADAVQLTGQAVDLLEMLSMRAPFGHPVPSESRWLFTGLAEIFDTTPDFAAF